MTSRRAQNAALKSYEGVAVRGCTRFHAPQFSVDRLSSFWVDVGSTARAGVNKNMAKDLIRAGIDILRISCIGFNRKTYAHWMGCDGFDEVRENLKTFVKLNEEMNGITEVHVYHLITDIKNKEQEIQSYRRNWADYTGAKAEIWLMHNWAGSEIELGYKRITKPMQKRSCGRPFSPLLQVRAGGIDGHHGAVVACCMVLGKDSSAVLGHLDDQTIKEVVSGDLFKELRNAHSHKNKYFIN